MDRHRGERYGNNNSDQFHYKHSRGPPSPRTYSDGSGNPQHHHHRSPDVYRVPRLNRAFHSPPRQPTDTIAAGVDSGRLNSNYQTPPPPYPPSGKKRGYPFPEQVDEGGFAKLFVGSVPRTATEEDIRPLFEEEGRVLEVAFIKDKRTGQQQGPLRAEGAV